MKPEEVVVIDSGENLLLWWPSLLQACLEKTFFTSIDRMWSKFLFPSDKGIWCFSSETCIQYQWYIRRIFMRLFSIRVLKTFRKWALTNTMQSAGRLSWGILKSGRYDVDAIIILPILELFTKKQIFTDEKKCHYLGKNFNSAQMNIWHSNNSYLFLRFHSRVVCTNPTNHHPFQELRAVIYRTSYVLLPSQIPATVKFEINKFDLIPFSPNPFSFFLCWRFAISQSLEICYLHHSQLKT